MVAMYQPQPMSFLSRAFAVEEIEPDHFVDLIDMGLNSSTLLPQCVPSIHIPFERIRVQICTGVDVVAQRLLYGSLIRLFERYNK